MPRKTKPTPKQGVTKAHDPHPIENATGSDDPEIQIARIQEVAGLLRITADLPEDQQMTKIAAAMATLAEIAPRQGTERMLAVQMIGCHEAAVECLRRAMLPDQTFEGRDMSLKHAAKLMATYAKLVATLDKHRGKGQQKVTVEHVHVGAGGQAIVGNVEGRGIDDAPRQTPQQAPREIDHAPGVPVEPIKTPQKTRSPQQKRIPQRTGGTGSPKRKDKR